MAKRGRPPSARAASARIVHVKLRLYPGEDDDLIAFFDSALTGLRATTVKQALRSGIRDTATKVNTSDSVFDMLDALVE